MLLYINSSSFSLTPSLLQYMDGMGDCVRVQFPVEDMYLDMLPATQVNSAWPSYCV